MVNNNVSNIRKEFAMKMMAGDFVIDKSGVKMLEIVGTSFVATAPAIFGTPNEDYIARELEWYESQSLAVADIPGDTPKIWLDVADRDGNINSNYGWCIHSKENGDQFANAVKELQTNEYSRRAEMIYTRPTMWKDYKKKGMSDFMCTEAVQYVVRDGMLHAIVKMRSNDAIFGYRNDYAWQVHVRDKVLASLDDDTIRAGNIYWCAGSIHIYERHFKMVERFLSTGMYD